MKRLRLTANGVMAILVALVLIMGAANLEATRVYVNDYKAYQAREQAVQRKAGAAVETALCTDLGTMAAIRPPPGNAKANPSRAYADAEHRAWAGLVRDLGCR